MNRITRTTPDDPSKWLTFGLVLNAILFITTGFILPIILPESVKTTLIQFSSLLTVLIGLFSGALVYKKIYDYVNHQKQIRDWQHDYALSQIREIYAPLYDETNNLIEQLQAFGTMIPSIEERQFSMIKKKHLSMFMDSRTYNLLETFHKALDNYEEIHRQTWNDFYHSCETICIETTGLDPQGGNVIGLRDFLIQNWGFFLGSAKSQKLHKYILEAFIRTYIQTRGLKQEHAENDFNTITLRIQSLPSVKNLKAFSIQCQEMGELAMHRLTEVIKYPDRIILKADSRLK